MLHGVHLHSGMYVCLHNTVLNRGPFLLIELFMSIRFFVVMVTSVCEC